MSHSEDIRAYWREAQRRHRAKKADLASKGFTPRITQFQLCSMCGEWHPTRAILPDGTFARFNLDSFHNPTEINDWRRNVRLLVDLKLPEQDPLDKCVANLKDEGWTEKKAKEECEKRIEDPDWRKSDDQLEEVKRNFITQLEMCTRSRMEFYEETREVAEANCKILLEDPLLRHTPPGLIMPGAIDNKPEETRGPDMATLGKCFTRKVLKEGLDPQEAVQECMFELQHKKAEKEAEKPRETVGDLFGKTPAEIEAMRKKPEDDKFTVGDLYGQTKKEILKQQRKKRNN